MYGWQFLEINDHFQVDYIYIFIDLISNHRSTDFYHWTLILFSVDDVEFWFLFFHIFYFSSFIDEKRWTLTAAASNDAAAHSLSFLLTRKEGERATEREWMYMCEWVCVLVRGGNQMCEREK